MRPKQTHIVRRRHPVTRKLYVMRHAETLFNLQKKIQGWRDSPLTERGIKQAKAAGVDILA